MLWASSSVTFALVHLFDPSSESYRHVLQSWFTNTCTRSLANPGTRPYRRFSKCLPVCLEMMVCDNHLVTCKPLFGNGVTRGANVRRISIFKTLVRYRLALIAVCLRSEGLAPEEIQVRTATRFDEKDCHLTNRPVRWTEVFPGPNTICRHLRLPARRAFAATAQSQ
jgi:hypothetical protein